MNCPTAISLLLQECAELNISFHLLLGYAKDVLPTFVTEHGVGGLVTDFSPLRLPRQWVEDVRERLPEDVPFAQVGASTLGMENWLVRCGTNLSPVSDLSREHVCRVVRIVCFLHPSPRLSSQVDAHNIVPCWLASPKQEYSARTIRGKIHAQLPEFLTEFPPVVRHPHPPSCSAEVPAGDTQTHSWAGLRVFHKSFVILGGVGRE